LSLRIVYGRAGSGKSHFCLNDIKDCLKEQSNKKLFLIVPEQYSLQAEKNLVKMLNNHGIMRAEVLTFKRMAWKVFNEVGGAAAINIDSIGKNMIIYSLLEKHKDSLRVYGNSAGRQGFVSSVSDLIAELKRYRVEPGRLLEMQKSLSEEELLRLKLSDLELIFSEYEKIIQEKYSDDELNLLAKRIPESENLKNSLIWIDEFHGFIPQEYEVIGQLLKVAEKVSVTLTTDCLLEECNIESTNIFSPSHTTGAKLAKVANSMGAGILRAVNLNTTIGPLPRFKGSIELSHIEKYFFTYPIVKYEAQTKDISLLVSSNLFSEVEQTAIDIITLVRDEGLRFRDIAVVTRNLDGYSRLVQAIFPQYGIPFFIDMKRDIGSHPLVMLIKSTLEIFNRSFSYDGVFGYVKTGLCNISQEEANTLENYVLAWGIRGSKWYREEAWDFVAKTADEEMDTLAIEEEKKIDIVRRALVSPLLELRNTLRGRKTSREYCEALFDFLCRIQVPEKINELVLHFKEKNYLAMAEEYEQVWNQVMGILDQIVEVSGDEKLNVEEFSNMLEVGLSECGTGLIPPSVDDILVGSIERSKSHEIKVLFILGANDGVFPMVTNKEGLLSDGDRRKLADSGVELAADTRSKAFEEQFLVYTAITTPSQKLRLSYPIADAEGKSLRPSIIVSKLKRVFPKLLIKSNILPPKNDVEELALLSATLPAYNSMVPKLSKYASKGEITPLWKSAYRWFSENENYKYKCKLTLEALGYTNNPRMLTKETTTGLFGTPLYSSVSRLEKYAACPFAHYIQFGLKATERKVYKVSAPDIGSFMHEVLDKVSREVESNGLSLRDCSKENIETLVDTSMEELLKSKAYQVLVSTKRSSFLAKRLKRIMKRAVWLIVEHLKNSGFQPIGYEIQFGGQGELNYIDIELIDGNKMRLTGRIDRLDAMKSENGTYFRIIDYKSGNKELKLQDAYYGLQLQLLTYMTAVEKQDNPLLQKPLLPGGVLYFRLDDPIITSDRGMDDEAVELAIKSKLKMKGLLLADPQVIMEMDQTIEGDSKYIPARINKDGNLGRSSAATLEQFGVLERYIEGLLKGLGNRLTRGDVKLAPYKRKKQTACEYCAYGSVCAFDPTISDNNYKNIRTMKNDEAIGCMREQVGSGAQEGSED